METIPDYDAKVDGLRHERAIEVSWGHCDAAAVVFYPQYFAWFDACTHALLESVGLAHHALRARYGVLGTPLVDARARFVGPATFGQTLRAESWVHELGTRSLRVHHRLSRDGATVCEGYEVRVWATADAADPTRMKTAPIPDEVRALLRPR